ncbi:hypothetical protein ACQPXM_39700 [Kribbella sp. CA-253562]|uniref:galactose-binding domain-containing protein n=1 Tax=Kribbella sp. CA-253562 TaxID=3239942 RepID=UPI003D8D630D
MSRTALTLTATVAATVVATTTFSMLTATTSPGGKPAGVQVTTNPRQLSVVGLPCFPARLDLTMTNTEPDSRYADLTLAASGPLQLSREVFSSYLPATDPDQPVSAPVEVRVPRDAEPGTYRIDLEADGTKVSVPVQVEPLPPKTPRSNVALGEQATASSTHGNFAVCGAVDGDKDSEHWDTLTGWNDGTRAAFPDTYDVALAASTTISRVELYTLDSVKYPAATNGLRDWDVQVRSGSDGWRTVAEVRGNTLGHVTSTFAPVAADAVRILALAGNGNSYSRIVELEVYGS